MSHRRSAGDSKRCVRLSRFIHVPSERGAFILSSTWCFVLCLYWAIFGTCFWIGVFNSNHMMSRHKHYSHELFLAEGSLSQHQLQVLATVNSLTAASPERTVNMSSTNEGMVEIKRSDSKIQEWQNKYNLVHVVHTRFMQMQPNLTHLGEARLDLFRTITLPSIMHQSSLEFLWIIRTDPHLDAALSNALRHEVDEVPNAVLIGSNRNEDDIRNFVNDATEVSVLSGSHNLVMSFHSAAQTRLVLETRLDADDAISSQFIESIQKRAYTRVTSSRKSHFSWMILCPFESLEWQLFRPWGQNSDQGLVLFVAKPTCMTPGLTYVFSADADRSKLPTHNHGMMSKLIPACKKRKDDKCLQPIPFSTKTTTFRARTPTSAGMDHVLSESVNDFHRISQFVKYHENIWTTLESQFGINATMLIQLRFKLLENLSVIVDDALQGQCTKGHSCKKSAKKQLEHLRETDNK